MFAERTLRSALSLRGLNRGQGVSRDAVGIEVEVEHPHRSPFDIPGPNPPWIITEDGSLRNGAEFVSTPIEDYVAPLEYLGRYLSDQGYVVNERCSVHVHLNILDMTEREVLNFILLYTAFERLLNRISGNRDTNTYCLSIYQSMEDYRDLVNKMKEDIYSGSCFNNFIHNSPESRTRRSPRRYACLSLVRAREIGTIEVRSHEGTLDMMRVSRWVTYLMCLKKAALEMTPEFLLECLDDTPSEIFSQVFREHLEDFTADYLKDIPATDYNIAAMYDQYRKGFYCAASLYRSPPVPYRRIAQLEEN